jgi:hypothetical protein
MSGFKKLNFQIDHKFDRRTNRHYVNGELSVLHCHHYSTLYTQLAMDAHETELLTRVAEDTFYEVLSDYFTKNQISDLQERVEIACQYFSAVGLGKMKVLALGDDSGEVRLLHSHIDEGWIKKWGHYDKPVNYIVGGYISALFSSVLNAPRHAFNTLETESIVMGAERSTFKVTRK